MNPQSRTHRKPPDVEEALSSMLWTPYDNNISESDSSDEMEVLHRVNNNYSFFGTGANQDHRRYPHRQQQQSLMRRSLSAWSYRSRTGKPNPIGECEAGNRFSYPYYDQSDHGFGTFGGGLSSAWYGYGSTINTSNNNYTTNGMNGSSYGYSGVPVTSSRSSYSFQPTVEQGRTDERGAPWQTLTATTDRSIEKRPYLQQLQTPFVGRWQSGVGASQLETSSLPYSLLALDSLGVTGTGATSTGVGREVDGFADSYRDDYQVYSGTGNGENMASGCLSKGSTDGSNINSINNNIDGTCNNNNNDSLCIISAMLRPASGNEGDLHFPSAHQHWQGHGQGRTVPATPPTPGQHNSSITAALLLPTMLPYDARPGSVGTADARITRTPATAAVGEGFTMLGSAVACADSTFNCVRQANAATSTLVRRADGAQADRVRSTDTVQRSESDQRVDQQTTVVHNSSTSTSGVSPERVVAMRLNVPAAGLAEGGSRTSVYIPSTVVTPPAEGGGVGALLPALSIQVNRLDPNNQQQNDVVNNAASGVSIVSCYRAAKPIASVASGASGPAQAADSVSEGCKGSKCIVERDERGEDQRTEATDRGDVNACDANVSSSEQMVQVSSVVERLNVDRGVGENGVGAVCGGSTGSAVSAPSRTYTSTEAQTDDSIQQPQQQHQQQQLLLQHPTGLIGTAAFIGSASAAGPPEPIVATMLGPGSEFSTREHRRRERRERRQARNRLQHIHPLEPPPPLHRSPPPIEIIPDILHSHLPPPYTTLPMGASLIPQMIPANAVAAAAAAAAAIPVRAADDCRYTFPIPIMRSSPSERSRKGCCGHWFAGPPLRALIAVVALGGVACALGGAALGATGLAGSPTSHLTAALLMIGVGVILVTVSGAAWRMTAPGAPPCLGLGSTVDLGRCSRRPCGRGGSTPHGLLYPEFQHRPPPPSYQASMQEYRLRLLLLDRDRQSGRMRSTASPPPTYRSNVGSLLRIPLSSRYNNGSSNSIFGGISGIISGAVGGGSSNSVNNVPPPPPGHTELQVNSSPNPYGSDGHSTLSPSYRSVNLHPSPTVTDSIQRPSQQQQTGVTPGATAPSNTANAPAGHGRDSGRGTVEDANLISDDNTHRTNATGVNHHAPSIIKIDDRCTAVPGTAVDEQVGSRQRNSIPNVSLIDAGSSEEQKCSVESSVGVAGSNSTGSSINSSSSSGSSRLCPAGTGVPTTNGSGTKDLVTIVTISGTIEPSATGANRSVYTSSSSSSSSTSSNQPGAGGATCTLLNTNSTPLLATVIPVSKCATTTTPSSPSTGSTGPL
ncbi:uncharacterized protein LOC125771431 [Anopheles funestus]|uniref:uncharacterized protein LOC125771431 n=1 Tax=Anopheles funestus TaxID=62324 RepID=UPI0020C70E0F|nr:uncharacterized protein LOC125771431 [Anopheles funestus]XP_049298003.1 uncharacterized protein LOC125771431 [Anopheles funestus]XP_049298004.1 uncharacterized protein LOC125771431 [Anopheles funestus]